MSKAKFMEATVVVYGIDINLEGKSLEEIKWAADGVKHKGFMMPPDKPWENEIWHICFMTESQRDEFIESNSQEYKAHGFDITKTTGELRTLKSALGGMA